MSRDWRSRQSLSRTSVSRYKETQRIQHAAGSLPTGGIFMQAGFRSDDRQLETAPEPTDSGPGNADRVSGSISPLLDWLAYTGVVICSLTAALIGLYQVNADVVAYLDLSDAVSLHRWHALFNASWFPLYPALVALGKAAFGNRPQYEFMAARLVD